MRQTNRHLTEAQSSLLIQNERDKLREARGNVSSVKMSEKECAEEIAAITGIEENHAGEKGEFTAKFGLARIPHTVKYEISADGKSVKIDAPQTDIMGNLWALQPGQSVKVTGVPEIIQPKKRGWPKGKKRGPRIKEPPKA